MNPILAIFGLVGLLAGAGIYGGAGAFAQRLPILLSGVGSAVAFAFLLLISLAELPLMLFGLRYMVRSTTMPRGFVTAAFTIFVMFAAVYASIFVLVTGEFSWGLALAALSLVRYAGGAFLK